jgi:hypothetical protein
MTAISNPARWLISIVVIASIALSWTHVLDDAASEGTLSNFKRTLTVAAVARAFNGVISVAQGTEVAIQPVGVGVTLTLGEILDPLNDLVERFSYLTLLASVALGVQLSLSEIATTPWLSGILSLTGIALLFGLWRNRADGPPATGIVHWLLRIVATLILARFLLSVVMITTYWIDEAFLRAKQEQAMTQLTTTSEAIESMQNNPPAAAAISSIMQEEEDEGFIDRSVRAFSDLLDSSKQSLDLQAQLTALQNRVESSVEQIIQLIVIFVLQTALLPLAGFWLCLWGLRQFWHWSRGQTHPE